MMTSSNTANRGGYSRFTDETTGYGGYGSADAGPSSPPPPIDHRLRHQQLIDQQNAGLENLSVVITRQKELAVNIGREVESQNDLIDDITTSAEQTNDRLRRTTTNVETVARKSSTFVYWIVIVLLACAIIAVAAIPF